MNSYPATRFLVTPLLAIGLGQASNLFYLPHNSSKYKQDISKDEHGNSNLDGPKLSSLIFSWVRRRT